MVDPVQLLASNLRDSGRSIPARQGRRSTIAPGRYPEAVLSESVEMLWGFNHIQDADAGKAYAIKCLVNIWCLGVEASLYQGAALRSLYEPMVSSTKSLLGRNTPDPVCSVTTAIVPAPGNAPESMPSGRAMALLHALFACLWKVRDESGQPINIGRIRASLAYDEIEALAIGPGGERLLTYLQDLPPVPEREMNRIQHEFVATDLTDVIAALERFELLCKGPKNLDVGNFTDEVRAFVDRVVLDRRVDPTAFLRVLTSLGADFPLFLQEFVKEDS